MSSAPSVALGFMGVNAARKARKGYLINAAQVSAILAVARRWGCDVIVVNESYPGQKRAWRRRRRVWIVLEATPNDAGGRGNLIALRRRRLDVDESGEVTARQFSYPLHFPWVRATVRPFNRRLRRLVAAGWRLPRFKVIGFHFPRKPLLGMADRTRMAGQVGAEVETEPNAVAIGDTNDVRLVRYLSGDEAVAQGIDVAVFAGEWLNVHGRTVQSRIVGRLTDHRRLVVARARLPLTRV